MVPEAALKTSVPGSRQNVKIFETSGVCQVPRPLRRAASSATSVATMTGNYCGCGKSRGRRAVLPALQDRFRPPARR
jgi:hypothetical protein